MSFVNYKVYCAISVLYTLFFSLNIARRGFYFLTYSMWQLWNMPANILKLLPSRVGIYKQSPSLKSGLTLVTHLQLNSGIRSEKVILLGARGWCSQLRGDSWFRLKFWSQGCEIDPCTGLCTQHGVCLRLSPFPSTLSLKQKKFFKVSPKKKITKYKSALFGQIKHIIIGNGMLE